MSYNAKPTSTRVLNRATSAILGGLARQGAELHSRRSTLRGEINLPERNGCDTEEWSADQCSCSLSATLLENTGRTMRKVEDALSRLKNKSYGSCVECGERIAPARLEALPFADRCRDCQEVKDVEDKKEQERERMLEMPRFF